MMSVTLSLPSSLNASRVSDQTPSFLIASTNAVPDAFGPLTEKLSDALPLSFSVEIEPDGLRAVIGVPSALVAIELL